MPGPLHFPAILVLFPFRFRDPISGKWVRAWYKAERSVTAARYAEWGIILGSRSCDGRRKGQARSTRGNRERTRRT